MTVFTLVQIGKQAWSLVAPSGVVIVEYIHIEGSVYDAKEWCRAYISCYPTASYDVYIPNKFKKKYE